MAYSPAPFHVAGQCSGFVLKDGYLPKYLKLSVSAREYWMKIPKAMRETILQDEAIAVGAYLEVWGIEERKSYKQKLTVSEIKIAGSSERLPGARTSQLSKEKGDSSVKSRKQRILVCQKSNCWKRGGKQLCEAIQSHVSDRGLPVQVQLTGCLKDCKKAPNLVVLPDKSRYHHLTPASVPALLGRHFEGS